MPVVLITPESMRETSDPYVAMFRQAGFEIRYPKNVSFARGLGGEEECIRELAGIDAVVASGELYTERVLSEMGLGGLDIMTDAQALTVRGHGFMNGSSARVFGNSFATFDTPSGTSHSENGYAAEGRRHADAAARVRAE